MFKSMSMFILFRKTSLSAAQRHSYKTSFYLNNTSKEQANILSKNYEYFIHPELNKRLSSIPYKKLLESAEDIVSKDLVVDYNKAFEDAKQRLYKIFDYNTKKSNTHIASIFLLKAYCTYCYDIEDTHWNAWDSDGWKKAIILAWCFELFQACMISHDDLLDQSAFRRGESCWYTLPDVGLLAVFDGLLMQCGIYKLLQNHFGSLTCYNDLVQEFLLMTEKLIYGQSLDLLSHSAYQGPESFTFKRYNSIVEYKTAQVLCCLPLHLVIHHVGGYSDHDINYSTQMGLKLGMYIQMLNDHMDFFGDPKVTGVDRTDIQNGKCNWFAVKFLEQASDSEKKEFVKNYGCQDETSVSKVLSLYNSSSLQEKYESAMDKLASEILSILDLRRSWEGGLYAITLSQLRETKMF